MQKTILTACCLLLHICVLATHLRAGEITVTRNSCSGLTFRVTITVFTDLTSTVKFGHGILDFGDGTSLETPETPNTIRPDLGRDIGTVTYTAEHTFSGQGRYVISYFEHNRNNDVLNIFKSVDTPFSLRTVINIDKLLGCNNSPHLLVPPIDHGCTGATWSHNPGAYDPDGDSLSFELFIPQRDRNQDVAGYLAPNAQTFYDLMGNYNTANEQQNGPPTFEIDPVKGTVKWDAPGKPGQYNIAFIVKEWRKLGNQWVVLGYVERDMQILIEDCENKRPKLEIPPDLCVEAGTVIDKKILGTDPDNDNVKLEAFSEVLNLAVSPAQFTPNPAVFQPSAPKPAEGRFLWKTDCAHVKEQPYQVAFKVSDKSYRGPSLADYKTWNIRVVGPAPKPKTLTYDRASGSATFTWERYICRNASAIQVWRRVKSFPYTQKECVTGMPDNLGYTKIATVANSTVSYNDSNNKKRLAAGAQYCYRLVAEFPDPAGGKSYVSDEACLEPIPIDRPVITQVTIDKTDIAAGQLTLKWIAPNDPEAGLTPPFTYEVFRGNGLTGQQYVKSFPGKRSDLTWQENEINTKESSFNYRVLAWDNADKKTDSSKMASQVWLSAKASFKKVELTWSFNVPWSNRIKESPWHEIYRAEEGQPLVLLDKVDVMAKGFHYVDDGSKMPLDNTKKYCYYVITYGGYGNPAIPEPLKNSSQLVCNVQPDLKLPPCKLTIDSRVLEGSDCEKTKREDSPCSPGSFSNTLFWPRPADRDCRSQISYYKVYRASYVGDKFELIAPSVPDTFYIDKHLSSFASCYKISAVNLAGLEGETSESLCFDNCPVFELPNVFSPNGDNCNDLFSAFSDRQKANEQGKGNCGTLDDRRQRANCARFVKSVDFKVVNRYGKTVFGYLSGGENSIYIDWNGKDESGKDLPSGTYYYTCEVIFDVVDPSKQKKILKGWLQLIR